MKKFGFTLLLLLTSNIYSETINGHILPPEPDPIINNSTLLGIDSNNNGVRDDVERWIYEEYEEPIEQGLLMQNARAYNIIIINPLDALQTKKYLSNATSCEFYLLEENSDFSAKYKYVYFNKRMREVQFNTIKRIVAYKQYKDILSGGVYAVSTPNKEKCEFNDKGILKALKDK